MNKILVLLYHGVTTEENTRTLDLRNYNFKHLNKKIFEKQIQIISKKCNIISVNELVNYWNGNYEYKKPTVLVTFDDGFRNNLHIAKPILEKYQVPATFYISTGNVSNQELFWVDILEIIFNKSKLYKLDKERMPHLYKLFFNHSKNIIFDNRNSRIEILNKVKKKLKLCHPIIRNKIIENISNELEVENSFKVKDYHPDYSILNWEEVKKIELSDLFTIGGHSRWHNILSTLTGEELVEEIKGSIEDLKTNLGSFSGHYAYPEGQKDHFNIETIQVLKKFGVKSCPSAQQGLAEKNTQSLFDFKRVMVGIDQSSKKYLKDFIL